MSCQGCENIKNAGIVDLIEISVTRMSWHAHQIPVKKINQAQVTLWVKGLWTTHLSVTRKYTHGTDKWANSQ